MAAARKLHRRKGRATSGAFLIEGLTQLREAFACGADVLEVFGEDTDDGSAAEQLCSGREVRFSRVDSAVGHALSQTVTAPGVVAIVRTPGVALSEIPSNADLVLVLAEVRDPGNAGTLIRSAAAAGADAVVFSTRAVDPLSPKTVRSAAGAVFRVPLVRDVGLDVGIKALRGRGFAVVGTDAHTSATPESCDMTRSIALVLGNEAQGIPGPVEGLIDEVVGIPMPGSAESLNVGVAGSILLFEAVRQRRRSSRGDA